MADALCGPSNALQSFTKHSSVDRTLQQDRVVGRHSPSQNFRSPSGLHAGALDPEFEAFQAGRPGALPQDFHHPPLQFAPQPPPQFAQAGQAPGWASDFQRLNISGSPIHAAQRQQQQQQQQPAHAAASWHQDFLMHQAPAVQSPAQQQSTYGGMPGYSMGGFGGQSFMQAPAFHNAPASQVALGKQPVQEAVPAFDEAAFEQAFLQAEREAQQDLDQSAQANAEAVDYDRPGEMDPLLMRIRETRPAVYSAIQVWSETGLGRTGEAVAYLENMTRLEQSGKLVEDANEAKWIVDSLQRIVSRDAPQEVKTRADSLITAINARLMSQYPLGSRIPMSEEQIWQDLDAAGYMRTPENERAEERKDEQPQMNDEDEMAATAGRLLERVADNTSEKFQNSQFLELMRRLRDREVRVEEDKIVETNGPSSAPSSSSTQQHNIQHTSATPAQSSSQIPPIDRTILEHASTDFSMPDYPQDMYQNSLEREGHDNLADYQRQLKKLEAMEGKRKLEAYQQQLMELEHQNKQRLLRNLAKHAAAKIPRNEQDEDAGRFERPIPGRDPVIREGLKAEEYMKLNAHYQAQFFKR